MVEPGAEIDDTDSEPKTDFPQLRFALGVLSFLYNRNTFVNVFRDYSGFPEPVLRTLVSWCFSGPDSGCAFPGIPRAVGSWFCFGFLFLFFACALVCTDASFLASLCYIIWERAVLINTVRAEPRKVWKTKMVMTWSKKRALDLSTPPSCTKFRHDSHGTNGFASYETQKN